MIINVPWLFGWHLLLFLTRIAFKNECDILGESDPLKIIKVMANEGKSGEPHELAYTNCKVIGNGSFGVVFQAKLVSNGEDAAIKKVLQDKRFKVSNTNDCFRLYSLSC